MPRLAERLIVGILLAAAIGTVAGAGMAQLEARSKPGIFGPVTVIDGDTIKLGAINVRIYGIDAPEIRQTCDSAAGLYPCGQEAKAMMVGIVAREQVRCLPQGLDRYGRTVATCQAGEVDVGKVMVRLGWAVAYHGKEGRAYLADEAAAREAHAGLWGGTFQEPSLFRKGRKG